MKIRVLSDLHLEMGSFSPLKGDEDVIVLAGDINLDSKAIAWIKENFSSTVIYVPGNHEFYGNNFGSVMRHLKRDTQGSDIHVLNNSTFIKNDIRFIGFTLWTDYNLTGQQNLSQVIAKDGTRTTGGMNDFKKIRDEQYRKIRPYQLAAKHMASRNYLEQELAKPFDGKTVVVSHHAPSMMSFQDRDDETEDDYLLRSSYASNLEQYFGSNIALWIHGHLHNSSDYEKNGTRVICNPRGYYPAHLNKDFQENLIINL